MRADVALTSSYRSADPCKNGHEVDFVILGRLKVLDGGT